MLKGQLCESYKKAKNIVWTNDKNEKYVTWTADVGPFEGITHYQKHKCGVRTVINSNERFHYHDKRVR